MTTERRREPVPTEQEDPAHRRLPPPAAPTRPREKGEVEIRSWKSPWAGPPGLCQQCRVSLISFSCAEMVRGEGRAAVPQNPHGRKGAGAGGCPRGCLGASNLESWEPHPGGDTNLAQAQVAPAQLGQEEGNFPHFRGKIKALPHHIAQEPRNQTRMAKPSER